MLGNCEKMVVIPSTSTEWTSQPQAENQIDEKGLLIMDSSSARRVLMEKPNQDQQQQQQQQQQQAPLKCPRCDSSNTKFCYYNNYSLSQPRHFCKACKRYWTRGGTLRNVPVGGGCRKNKRVKRPASASEATSSSSAQTATSNPSSSVIPPQLDLSSSASHINPLFYSLLTNNHHSSELNSLAYPRFSSNGAFDLHQPQMSDLGLGFSSGLLTGDVNGNDYRINGFNSSKQIHQDVAIPSNISLLSSYNPIFGSVSSSSTSTIGSLLASSLQRQKFAVGGLKDASPGSGFHGFEPYEDMQMVKDVKIEEGQNRMEWGVANGQNHIEQINSSDQSLLWNTTGVGAWLDPSSMGSSVPSLI